MTALIVVVYVVLVVVAVAAVVWVVVAAWSALRGRKRKWVERSGRDRRQRAVPVRQERRKGPRRQEDIARGFLDRLGG